MYAVRLLYTLIAITATVAAVVVPSNSNEPDLDWLSADSVILVYADKPVQVVSREEFEKSVDEVSIATPEQHNGTLAIQGSEEPIQKIEKRCRGHTIWKLNPVENFHDWDIAMSGIVLAPHNDTALVKISQGITVGNSLYVNPNKFDMVSKFLSASLGIGFGYGWTTSGSSGFGFKVPPGKYGAVVSNPYATRHSGHADIGCIGSAQRTEFSSISYRSRSYSGMNWVEGVIGLCIGDTLPLPRCHGNGTL